MQFDPLLFRQTFWYQSKKRVQLRLFLFSIIEISLSIKHTPPLLQILHSCFLSLQKRPLQMASSSTSSSLCSPYLSLQNLCTAATPNPSPFGVSFLFRSRSATGLKVSDAPPRLHAHSTRQLKGNCLIQTLVGDFHSVVIIFWSIHTFDDEIGYDTWPLSHSRWSNGKNLCYTLNLNRKAQPNKWINIILSVMFW